jgi:hypothetical protein
LACSRSRSTSATSRSLRVPACFNVRRPGIGSSEKMGNE